VTGRAEDLAAGWVTVCRVEDLDVERGTAALVGSRQVALFRLPDGAVRAVDHRDPFSGANVMARGIVGTRGDVTTLTSPMHKQVFDLATGRCLDDADRRLGVHAVRIRQGRVEVGPRLPDTATDPSADPSGVP
jgi:nitrite reductase (NADH) small subunit